MPKSKSVFIGGKKPEGPVDISDIDLEDVEDEYLSLFGDENFRTNEWYISTTPFVHW